MAKEKAVSDVTQRRRSPRLQEKNATIREISQNITRQEQSSKRKVSRIATTSRRTGIKPSNDSEDEDGSMTDSSINNSVQSNSSSGYQPPKSKASKQSKTNIKQKNQQQQKALTTGKTKTTKNKS